MRANPRTGDGKSDGKSSGSHEAVPLLALARRPVPGSGGGVDKLRWVGRTMRPCPLLTAATRSTDSIASRQRSSVTLCGCTSASASATAILAERGVRVSYEAVRLWCLSTTVDTRDSTTGRRTPTCRHGNANTGCSGFFVRARGRGHDRAV